MSTTTLPNANSHFISLQTAIDMTTLYRSNRELMLSNTFKGREVLPLNETFHREAIEALLNVPGCAGIRIYSGQDESEKVHAIVVAVNDLNEDLLPSSMNNDLDDPPIVEVGQRCPPTCPPASVLNL